MSVLFSRVITSPFYRREDTTTGWLFRIFALQKSISNNKIGQCYRPSIFKSSCIREFLSARSADSRSKLSVVAFRLIFSRINFPWPAVEVTFGINTDIRRTCVLQSRTEKKKAFLLKSDGGALVNIGARVSSHDVRSVQDWQFRTWK